jgi:hypothetical protein
MAKKNNIDRDPSENFIIPVKDAKGHDAKMWFRCQPGMVRQMDIVLRSRKFPYRTQSDIIRHAVVRHLEWLETLEEIPSVMREVDIIMDILRDDQFHHDFGEMFNILQQRVSSHISTGATSEAKRVLAGIAERVKRMPDGYWKERYEKEIKSRFGHVQNGKGAPIKPTETDEGEATSEDN